MVVLYNENAALLLHFVLKVMSIFMHVKPMIFLEISLASVLSDVSSVIFLLSRMEHVACNFDINIIANCCSL